MSAKQNAIERVENNVHKGSRIALGTQVSIIVEHPDADEARDIINLAFDEIYHVHNLMSVYDKNSEVYALNRDGFYKDASPETIEVIKKGVFYSELSGGAFNVAILPVLRLWQEKVKLGSPPIGSEIEETLKVANWREITIKGRNIRFEKQGMGVTLAGVAKGFAIDKAIKAIENKGIKRAMVNGGGDIRVISQSGLPPWRIGVRKPEKKRELIAVIELFENAVATSGTYLRNYNDIIMPGGSQATEVQSSTVKASTAMAADALSTAIYILGCDKGISFIEEIKGVEALMVSQKGQIFESSNFNPTMYVNS